MRRIAALTTLLIAGLPALAENKPATTGPARAAQVVQRDLALEQTVFARAQSLQAALHPGVRAKLDLAARGLLTRLATSSENVDAYGLAQQEVRGKFAHLSGEQSDLLSFYVLAEAARSLANPNDLKGKLDGMGELSEMTSLRLQMMMDRRSKFVATLSNIMKSTADTQNTLVQNLK
ncbi:MAG TPA: hypothetical protein VLT83_05200 [Opitutaceae bacterium]|nr:hypothetical protein [Opitutaceae bacterium]